MSSFLSTAYTPTEIESTFNTPLAMKVMAMKQGTYDANKSKVDQTMALYKEKLRGLRDTDNEYISLKLDSLKSTLDQYGNKDYSLSSTTSDATTHIMSVLDDPIVKDAITNKSKYDSAVAEISAKKKKGDGTYSDDNFNDWRDQIGYTAYMKGEAKSLGNSEYVDYYDVKKNLTDSVEKYAKEKGFTKVLSETTDGYTYKTTKGVSVSPAEIENYVKSTISTDSKLRSQLEINSRARYRGASDADVQANFSGFAKKQEAEYNNKIQEVENSLKNVSKDDTTRIAELKASQVSLKSKRDEIVASADPQNFNRGKVLYENYEKEVINGYVSTFAQEAVTDVEYDDTPLKIAEAQNKYNEDGTKKVKGAYGEAGQVYEHTRTEQPLKEDESDMSRFRKEKGHTYAELNAYIRNKLTSEGKQVTQANVSNWYVGLKKAAKEGFDINASGYGADDINMYNKMTAVNVKTASYTKIAKANFGTATQETLNGLFGAEKKDLNVEGLRRSMPYTANLLTKYRSAEQMSPKERALALHEVAVNAKNTIVDDDAKEHLQLYINDLEREHKIAKTAPTAKSGTKDDFFDGFGGGFFDVLGGASRTAGNIFKVIGSSLIPYTRDSWYNRIQKEGIQGMEKGVWDAKRGLERMSSGLGSPFTTDSDLGELQSDDLNMKGVYKGLDAGDVFKKASNLTKSTIKTQVEKYRANEPKYSSMTLNPDIKADAPYVEQIRSALVADGYKPTKDTFINIDRIDGDKVVIRYSKTDSIVNKDGSPKTFTSDGEASIPLANVPSNLLKNIRLREADYNSSITNPTEMKVTYKYSPPKNLDSKIAMEEAYFQNNVNHMNDAQIREIQTNGIKEANSKEDYLKSAEILPPQAYAEYKSDVDAQYTVKYTRPSGGGRFNAVLLKNGSAVSRFELKQDFNPHQYQMETVSAIDNYLKKKLIESISKNK